MPEHIFQDRYDLRHRKVEGIKVGAAKEQNIFSHKSSSPARRSIGPYLGSGVDCGPFQSHDEIDRHHERYGEVDGHRRYFGVDARAPWT